MPDPDLMKAKAVSFLIFAQAAVLSLLTSPALARLGGDLASIQEDAAAISGTIEPVQAGAGYRVYVIRSTRHRIRSIAEYVTENGVVVALAVSSRGTINAKRFIESSYFNEIKQARAAAPATKIKGRASHGGVSLRDIVTETSGHPGKIVFRAYLPLQLPPALSKDMISPKGGE